MLLLTCIELMIGLCRLRHVAGFTQPVIRLLILSFRLCTLRVSCIGIKSMIRFKCVGSILLFTDYIIGLVIF